MNRRLQRARVGGVLAGSGYMVTFEGAMGLWGDAQVDRAIWLFILGIVFIVGSLMVDPDQLDYPNDKED